MSRIEQGTAIICYEEGFRNKAYYDSKGYPTIGYGLLLGPKNTPLDYYTFEMKERAARVYVEERVKSDDKLLLEYDWYTKLNTVRKAVILSCCYQLGVDGFLKFHDTIKALKVGDFNAVQKGMLESRVARKTAPERWQRQALVMSTGEVESVPEYESIFDKLCI